MVHQLLGTDSQAVSSNWGGRRDAAILMKNCHTDSDKVTNGTNSVSAQPGKSTEPPSSRTDPTAVSPHPQSDIRQMKQPLRPPRRAAAARKRNYCEAELYTKPMDSKQPYGIREGVAIGTLRLPGAGKDLFGVKASKDNPLLFKRAHEFVYVYATMDDVISGTEAQVLDSE
jgi:hypothetical protein